MGRLGAEKADNGAVANNNGGAIGFLNNACKVAVGAAVTATVTATMGPAAGAGTAAFFAAKDGITSMVSSTSPKPEEGGYYTLANSLKNSSKEHKASGSAEQYSNPDDDPICSHYVSSQPAGSENFVNGFFMPQKAMPMYLANKAAGFDTAEERTITDRIGALQRKEQDHYQQSGTAGSIAIRIGKEVADGPPPPKIQGSLLPAPGMS